MLTSRRRTLILGLALAIAILLVASQVHPTLAGRGQFSGATDAFRYSGQDDNGDIYMVVSVDTGDPAALEKYIEANRQRGLALVRWNAGEWVPVQITFAQPMPVSTVKAMVEQTDLQMTSFLQVGHSTISGKRGTRVQFGPLSGDIPEREAIDPATGEELVFSGIMVLQGEVRVDTEGLGYWLANDQVYLVDTSKLTVLDLAVSRHSRETANKQIEVSLPTPFWNLDW